MIGTWSAHRSMRTWMWVLMTTSLSLFGSWAHAFEGELEMTTRAGTDALGKTSIAVSRTGAMVLVSTLRTPQMKAPTTVKMLTRANDSVSYQIDDAGRRTMALDLKAMQKAMQPKPQHFTAKRLHDEKLLGYPCAHVQVTSTDGSVIELWTHAGLAELKSVTEQMGGAADPDLNRALAAVHAAGLPLKVVVHGKSGAADLVIEITRIEQKTMPASLFELPPGYTAVEPPHATSTSSPTPRAP